MKKRVGIITFHASHNYGSMLQAYALQKVILNMGFDCEIINFRTNRQKKFYQLGFQRGTVLGKIKRFLLLMPYYKFLLNQYQLFEDFLKKDLLLTTKEYSSLPELEAEKFNFDFFISGSDQIWNTSCLDFDWAYFLPFVHSGKIISYAASMGWNAEKSISSSYRDQIKRLISSYSALSVREEGTFQWIKKNCNYDAKINLDPTLLLGLQDWNDMINPIPIVEGDYIFVYSPFFNYNVLKLADRLSKHYKMKVVLTQVYDSDMLNLYKFLLFNKQFVIKLNVGPKEFLNLCKYAKLVCSGSFHMVIFSILLHTPFLVLDGMDDNRIRNILDITGLQSRSVSSDILLDPKFNLYDMDFYTADYQINILRKESMLWLKSVLK